MRNLYQAICVSAVSLDLQQSPMELRIRWTCAPSIIRLSHGTVRSVALLQAHEENILPYTVKNDSARAVTTFSRNFRFFALRKSLKMPEWNFSSIHDTCMSKNVYINS